MPQIYKNGLSVFMFMFAAMGNLTYVASILSRSTSIDNIMHALPFLVGSGGTLIFDLTIFTQFYHYSRNAKIEAGYAFLPDGGPSISVQIPSNEAPIVASAVHGGVRGRGNADDDNEEVSTVRGLTL
ncbi:hypothetical protein SYNPS1DRAFT_31030 [Syncephalis pseudoplumigaleata]|uniref:Uncharacterized protein n=1 Tax=Syncephalis pseudoplumigaleata TaxID=1712513 RepID=A0A4P9YTW5_9FUNG|nr:hypothetical protein SYNPS1DRAFT_31030 [Syncephalis pseudoplumigaleata]|eukprot:RKP23254.1 hypothetical protein SYNPS1DRAFT_31030 [Syncephalis pseudoplumigaleata]